MGTYQEMLAADKKLFEEAYAVHVSELDSGQMERFDAAKKNIEAEEKRLGIQPPTFDQYMYRAYTKVDSTGQEIHEKMIQLNNYPPAEVAGYLKFRSEWIAQVKKEREKDPKYTPTQADAVGYLTHTGKYFISKEEAEKVRVKNDIESGGVVLAQDMGEPVSLLEQRKNSNKAADRILDEIEKNLGAAAGHAEAPNPPAQNVQNASASVEVVGWERHADMSGAKAYYDVKVRDANGRTWEGKMDENPTANEGFKVRDAGGNVIGNIPADQGRKAIDDFIKKFGMAADQHTQVLQQSVPNAPKTLTVVEAKEHRPGLQASSPVPQLFQEYIYDVKVRDADGNIREGRINSTDSKPNMFEVRDADHNLIGNISRDDFFHALDVYEKSQKPMQSASAETNSPTTVASPPPPAGFSPNWEMLKHVVAAMPQQPTSNAHPPTGVIPATVSAAGPVDKTITRS